jgi:hypothetical protein
MKNITARILSIIVFILTIIAGLIFAALYLFRPEFMPYHEVAVGREWTEIDPSIQVLILALMRVSGGAFLTTSIALLFLMLVPLRNGKSWPFLAIPMIGLATLIPSMVATFSVKFNTPANPPYLLTAVLSGLLLIVFVLALIYRKK